MIRHEDVYRIGRMGKPHGVGGELSFMFDDDVFDRVDSDYLVLSVDGILVPFFIEEYRFKSGEVALVKFCDIDSQDRAAALTGCDVYCPRHLAGAGADEMSWVSLVGFTLVDAVSGGSVGRIASVDDATSNILFELEDGRLVPAAADLIDGVDAEGRTITVRLPEGVLDL